MTEALLSVESLSVDIEVPTGTLRAVRDVSFRVDPKETFALVGESGCGKTMTALALMGLLPGRALCNADRMDFDGIDLRDASDEEMMGIRGSRIAMIFQDATSALNPVFSIGTQLADVYLRHRGGTRRDANARALHWLGRLGISSPALRLRQYPHELSGGMRQRIMIAMALICEPKIVIADEPTTALDVTVQAQILELLVDLQQELELGLILIAHDLGVVANVADRVAVMYAGTIVETGSVHETLEQPIHPYTRALLACIPRRGRELGAIPGAVPTLVGELRGCMFRNRCSLAREQCAAEAPGLNVIRPGHAYRCLIPAAELAQLATSGTPT